MDDLIVPAMDYDNAIQNLEIVLNTASQHGLVIKWEKCNFIKHKIEYLGHIIEDGKVQPSERKTIAVKKFPEPSTVKTLQSFLGLIGYFRKFIPKYSIIARPLTNLLKGGIKFNFGKEELRAFNLLKQCLSDKPVLRLYRTGAETELHTDASVFGYGAILLQRDSVDRAFHPIYYASGKTSTTEQKYSSYELEVLAIVKALKKFRVYLLGIPFKIITDCQAFTMTMRKRDLCVRVARWALLLEEFQYVIEHRPGKSMVHVDALSRHPLNDVMLVDDDDEGILARIRKAQQEDPELKEIFESEDKCRAEGFVKRSGILYKEVNNDIKVEQCRPR